MSGAFFTSPFLLALALIIFHISTHNNAPASATRQQFCWHSKKILRQNLFYCWTIDRRKSLTKCWPHRRLSPSPPIINSNFFLCQRRALSYVILYTVKISNNVNILSGLKRRQKMFRFSIVLRQIFTQIASKMFRKKNYRNISIHLMSDLDAHDLNIHSVTESFSPECGIQLKP